MKWHDLSKKHKPGSSFEENAAGLPDWTKVKIVNKIEVIKVSL